MTSPVDQMLEVYGAAQLEHSYGTTAVLVRAGWQSAPFTTTWERVEYEVSDAEGFLTKLTSRAFVFPTSAAVLGDQVVEPRAGDRLRIVENDKDREFEILPLGNRPAAELLAGGFRWRVHTKRVNL